MSSPSPDIQTNWDRSALTARPKYALCPEPLGCGALFASAEGFDLHRGIQVRPEAEDAQDAGVCMPWDVLAMSLELSPVICLIGDRRGYVWFTEDDITRHAKMDRLRGARSS